MSWYSSFTAVTMVGATPVGIDIKDDLLMDLDSIEKKITKKTKAILYVHFTGLVKDLSNLRKICKKKKLKLYRDIFP